MGAIANLITAGRPSKRQLWPCRHTLFANNISYDENIASKAQAIIKDLVVQGKIPQARIKESYERVMRCKARLKSQPVLG
jgi:hypothetical protein